MFIAKAYLIVTQVSLIDLTPLYRSAKFLAVMHSMSIIESGSSLFYAFLRQLRTDHISTRVHKIKSE
jgi:hypothetical protein